MSYWRGNHSHLRPADLGSGSGDREGAVGAPDEAVLVAAGAGVHGEVPLVDRGAEPTQDGPHRAALLIGAADDAERCEVQDHAPAVVRRLEAAEEAESGGRDTEAVEDAWRRGGLAGLRRVGGGLRLKQGLDVFEGRGGGSGGERGGVGSTRLHPGRPHGGCGEDEGDGRTEEWDFLGRVGYRVCFPGLIRSRGFYAML